MPGEPDKVNYFVVLLIGGLLITNKYFCNRLIYVLDRNGLWLNLLAIVICK